MTRTSENEERGTENRASALRRESGGGEQDASRTRSANSFRAGANEGDGVPEKRELFGEKSCRGCPYTLTEYEGTKNQCVHCTHEGPHKGWIIAWKYFEGILPAWCPRRPDGRKDDMPLYR